MRGIRNPFRLTTSESVESDADFLRLFGPTVLDLLPDRAIAGPVLFIRSAPGGGKTTLLRIFTPTVILTLLALRSSEPYKETYTKLKQLDVLDEHGPKILGVMLACNRTFPSLADLDLSKAQADRLLLALLDARIILASLRSFFTTHHLRFPEDLRRVTIQPNKRVFLEKLTLPCDGTALEKWAELLELSVCDVIDTLSPADNSKIPGHDTLNSLQLLDHCSFLLDGKVTTTNWLIMLDDVHQLTSNQRVLLHKVLLDARNLTTTWVAERLEALTANELLSTGALEGRDYSAVVNLEDAWAKGQGRRSFATAMNIIAERRSRMADDIVIGSPLASSLIAALEPSQSSVQQDKTVELAFETIIKRLSEKAKEPYSGWVKSRINYDGTPLERLVALRSLEILIARDERKSQLSLDFELTVEELAHRDGSAVRNAAELFLNGEFGIPFYYGSEVLSQVAFQNIEQYLRLGGDLFEESLSAALIHRNSALTTERQEAILTQACERRFKELPRRANRDVLTFITAVGKYCKMETYRNNAPYAPGVTGIAISMSDRERLLDPKFQTPGSPGSRFANMLGTALSQNLFRATLDQKVKGGRYMVLYLNRYLCVTFRLPLAYGGYREKSLAQFISWLERQPTQEKLPL